jgi:hypothetical protein
VHGSEPGEEQRHLRAVEQDLLASFPSVPADEVKRRFDAIVHDFDGAPIRDFVPVLARKRAVEQLRSVAV